MFFQKKAECNLVDKVLQKLGFVRVKEECARIVWVRGRDGV